RRDHRQHQVAVRDRAAERAAGGPTGVDMDPLMIAGDAGEPGHHLVGHRMPAADPQVAVLAAHRGQFGWRCEGPHPARLPKSLPASYLRPGGLAITRQVMTRILPADPSGARQVTVRNACSNLGGTLDLAKGVS